MELHQPKKINKIVRIKYRFAGSWFLFVISKRFNVHLSNAWISMASDTYTHLHNHTCSIAFAHVIHSARNRACHHDVWEARTNSMWAVKINQMLCITTRNLVIFLTWLSKFSEQSNGCHTRQRTFSFYIAFSIFKFFFLFEVFRFIQDFIVKCDCQNGQKHTKDKDEIAVVVFANECQDDG